MKDEEKNELKSLFSDAMVDAMNTFQSKREEEEAKAAQQQPEKKNESGNDDKAGNGFSFRGFLLGE